MSQERVSKYTKASPTDRQEENDPKQLCFKRTWGEGQGCKLVGDQASMVLMIAAGVRKPDYRLVYQTQKGT